MKSVLARLEKIEKSIGTDHVVLRVKLKDGEKEMSVREFQDLDKSRVANERDALTIISGSNKAELLKVSYAWSETIADLFNHPQPSRNIEDFE